MPFGYIGQNQTKQKVKNSGVLSSFEISHLEKQGHAGGTLELIEEQNVSSATTVVDFTEIKENKYDVHLLVTNNFQHAGSTERLTYQFFENGVIESGSVYDNADKLLRSDSTAADIRTTDVAYGRYGTNNKSTANYKNSAYLYIYNAGDSSKYTYTTRHTLGRYYGDGSFAMEYGGGVLPQASKVDGIRLLTFNTGQNIISLTAKLYGVKQI